MLKDEGVRYLAVELLCRLGRLKPEEQIKHIDEIVDALQQRKQKMEGKNV